MSRLRGFGEQILGNSTPRSHKNENLKTNRLNNSLSRNIDQIRNRSNITLKNRSEDNNMDRNQQSSANLDNTPKNNFNSYQGNNVITHFSFDINYKEKLEEYKGKSDQNCKNSLTYIELLITDTNNTMQELREDINLLKRNFENLDQNIQQDLSTIPVEVAPEISKNELQLKELNSFAKKESYRIQKQITAMTREFMTISNNVSSNTNKLQIMENLVGTEDNKVGHFTRNFQ